MKEIIQKLSDDDIKKMRPTMEELEKKSRFPVSVIIENVRSLYNVGSMFRTSDGAFIEKLDPFRFFGKRLSLKN